MNLTDILLIIIAIELPVLWLFHAKIKRWIDLLEVKIKRWRKIK